MNYSYTHGGDIYSHGAKILDFSSNINPLGMPASAKAAYINALELCEPYPDYQCWMLREAISRYENIPPEHIFCSNGAADIIYRLCAYLRPKKALITAPSFSEYESALACAGSLIEYFYLGENNGFSITPEILPHIEGCDIVFLCNPNNPVGCTVDFGLLEKIVMKAAKENITIVIDECFMDFLADSHKKTAKALLGRANGKLIILKAFTKIFAMAGLRLGYCICPDLTVMDNLYRFGQPWPVSGPAQSAGTAALSEGLYIEKTIELINEERQFLTSALDRLGCKVFKSEANFILFFHENENLKEQLLAHNILIRDCSNYRGLKKGYYRIAVKIRKDNVLLINALENILLP